MKILVLNGPNMDMLGTREPSVYGDGTLAELEATVHAYATSRGAEARCVQSNSEEALIDLIHGARNDADGIVYNPGAHTHYSYALRDAVASIDVPVVEVHLSDTSKREPFRRISVIAPMCVAQVRGLGVDGYLRAIDILIDKQDLPRLGDGYEKNYPGDAAIIIAGEMEDSECDASAAPAGKADSEHLAGADSAPLPQGTAYPDPGVVSLIRQDGVRVACEIAGIDALMVRDTSNIQWLTAFDDVFDDERAHALIIARNGTVLHTDSRYTNAARAAAARACDCIDVDDSRVTHTAFAYEALVENDEPEGKLGIEDTIELAEYRTMADKFGEDALVPTTDIVRNLRAVKDAVEIARMRAAQAITDAAFSYIITFMKPGMTERDVQVELEDYMIRHGAAGLAFRSIVACGANGADPHAVPGDTRLEAGQCVVLDFGARAFGYCSDMTRTVFLGAPNDELARAYETMRAANERVEAMLAPGVTGKQAHELAELVLEEGGFGDRMGHGLGHGVGIDIHELPNLNTRNDKPLIEGNVVTVEPGIYLPGRFGMRLEDFGVITADGFQVLTQSTHEMTII